MDLPLLHTRNAVQQRPETGSVLFDEGFRVVALNLTDDAEKQVPICTDEAMLGDPTDSF